MTVLVVATIDGKVNQLRFDYIVSYALIFQLTSQAVGAVILV